MRFGGLGGEDRGSDEERDGREYGGDSGGEVLCLGHNSSLLSRLSLSMGKVNKVDI